MSTTEIETGQIVDAIAKIGQALDDIKDTQLKIAENSTGSPAQSRRARDRRLLDGRRPKDGQSPR